MRARDFAKAFPLDIFQPTDIEKTPVSHEESAVFRGSVISAFPFAAEAERSMQ